MADNADRRPGALVLPPTGTTAETLAAYGRVLADVTETVAAMPEGAKRESLAEQIAEHAAWLAGTRRSR